MKHLILLSICFFLVVSCKTTDTTNNSDRQGLHAVNQKDDAIKKSIMDIPILSERLKEQIMEQIASGNFGDTIKIEATPYDLDLKGFLYVFPNPTSSDAVVTINPNFLDGKISNEGGGMIPIELYYMGAKTETLELPLGENLKFVIPSQYLQKEGTYTVILSGTNISASFVVKK